MYWHLSSISRLTRIDVKMSHISWIIPIACLLLFTLFFRLGPEIQVAAQQSPYSTLERVNETLTKARETLQAGNTNETIQNLLTAQRMITEMNDTSSSIQQSKSLIRETVRALLSGKLDVATNNINFIIEQSNKEMVDDAMAGVNSVPSTKPVTPLQSSLPGNRTFEVDNVTSDKITNPVEKTVRSTQSVQPNNETTKTSNSSNTTAINIRTYENRIFGIKIQYPDTWSARPYLYNKLGNNTVVGFYSPSKTASQLGNISGVSGQFVPYLDIFVFDSKNISLDKIIDARIKRMENNSDIVIDSKPITIKGNNPAYLLIYSTITGGDEFFKKMQVYTVFNNKVYLITFTAQEALFSDYLPVVQKMIDSFEISALVSK